jgi:hypothetical protein
VALQGQLGVGPAHPPTVVTDADEPGPSAIDLDVDVAGPGIQGILDQLLDDGSRPLHDLAGRDLVDQILW